MTTVLSNAFDVNVISGNFWAYATASVSGGRGLDPIYCSNLNNTGAGSLYAISRGQFGNGAGPVVFEEGGVNDRDGISSTIRELVGSRTYYGNTAPGGFNVHGRSAILKTYADNVLWKHLRIRATDTVGDPTPNLRDAALSETHSNIIYDHCSFAYTSDEIVSAYRTAPDGGDNITFYRCIMGPPLANANHPDGAHPKGATFVGQKRLAMVQCIQHITEGRPTIHPMGLDGNAVINNWFWGWNDKLLRFGRRVETANPDAYIRMQHNIFIDSEGSEGAALIIESDVVGSMYFDGNWGFTSIQNDAGISIVDNTGTELENQSVNMITVRAELEALLIADCGANPTNRDEVDARVITDVQLATSPYISTNIPGRAYIDSMSDFVGMPTVSGQGTHAAVHFESLQNRIERQDWYAVNRHTAYPGQEPKTYLEVYLDSFVNGTPPTDNSL